MYEDDAAQMINDYNCNSESINQNEIYNDANAY